MGLAGWAIGLAGFVSLAAVAVSPSAATGGSEVVRILAPGDAYVVAFTSTCSRDSYTVVPPTNNVPSNQVEWACLAWRALGYDGLSGAEFEVVGHVNHPFVCSVVSSATGPAWNGHPHPADVVGADSIEVWFWLPGHDQWFYGSGGRVDRPSLGAVANRVTGGLFGGDPTVWPFETAAWYVENTRVNGATPAVTGNVDGPLMRIANEAGFDVAVECSF